jgi:REP element-mobilizing transposase RayT
MLYRPDLDGWNDPDVANVVVAAILQGEREYRYELGAWVLMPNHVHVPLRPSSNYDLASTVKYIKGHSAFHANKLLKLTSSRFWAKD